MQLRLYPEWRVETEADLISMLECHDADVRIGAGVLMYCAPYIILGAWGEDPGPQLAEARVRMAGDPDPLVRATAVTLSWKPSIFTDPDENQARRAESALRKAAVDETLEVRLAAAFACWRRKPSYKEILHVLRKDDHPAVRAVAWLRPKFLSSAAEEPSDISPGLHDENPIVRTICLEHMAGLLLKELWQRPRGLEGKVTEEIMRSVRNAPARLDAALKAEDVGDDPWLKTAGRAFLAGNMVEFYARVRSWQREQERKQIAPEAPPAEFFQEQEKAADTIAGLLSSGKPSHRALAYRALLNWLSVRTWPTDRSKPELGPIAAQAESEHLPARLICTVASGKINPAGPKQRVLHALNSQDRLERIARLWPCAFKEAGAIAPGIEKRIKTLMQCKRPAERFFAVRAAAVALPFEQCLDIFAEMCRTSELYAAGTLLSYLRNRPVLGDDEAGQVSQLLLLDAALETRNPTHQHFFLVHRRYWFENNDPLLLTYITESEPQALYDLVDLEDRSRGGRPWWFWSKSFAKDAVIERFAVLAWNPDGTPNPDALAATGKFIARIYPRDFKLRREKLLAIIKPFLEKCFRPGAPDAEVSAGGALLHGLLQKVQNKHERMRNTGITHLKWDDLPPFVHEALPKFMAYANRPTHRVQVAQVLSVCYTQLIGGDDFRLPAPVLEAVEKARAEIMENGSRLQQARLLTDMTRCGDDPVAASAVKELQTRLMDGAINEQRARREAFRAVARNSELVTPEFLSFCFDCISNPDVDSATRNRAIGVLAYRTDTYDRLLPAVEKVMEDDKFFNPPFGTFRRRLGDLTDKGEPQPKWAKAAGGLALKFVEEGSMRQVYPYRRAMEFYVDVSGTDAAQKVESMILNKKLHVARRAAAASQLIRANPQTKLLVEFAKSYDTLPVWMRRALGEAFKRRFGPRGKAELRGDDIAGAEDFLAKYLRDGEVWFYEKRGVLQALWEYTWVRPMPKLVAALQELAKDPELGGSAQMALRRMGQR